MASSIQGTIDVGQDISLISSVYDSPQSSTKLCALCLTVAKSVQTCDEEYERKDYIGTYGNLKNNDTCPTCQQIVHRFELIFKLDGLGPGVFGNDDQVYMQYSKFSRSWNFGVKRKSVRLVKVGSIIEDTIIDLEQSRGWIKLCDDEHSGLCHSIADPWSKIDFAPDLLLIDVEQQCLVQRPGSSRYSALSYVWGKPSPDGSEPFQTKLNNHIELRRKGAFLLPHIQVRIPDTIRDSIIFTKSMNIPYLWCDRFCIIQDDPVTKPAQLKAMASIYSNAYITIAACEGMDDKFGLPGVSQLSPRSCPFTKFNFTPECSMVSLEPTRSLDQQDATYHSRGWIFQEWTLSPRIIAFHHNTVSWVCRKLNYAEHGARIPISILPEDLDKASLATKQPNMDIYAEMVEEYSSRNLSYQGDAFFAFSAIITAMGRSMPCGTLFGLPEVIFDGSLLWITRGTSSRRTDANGKILSFPSWSWIAWNGGIDTHYWKRAHVNLGSTGSKPGQLELTIHPLVTWHKISATDGSHAKIQNTYYEASRQIQNPTTSKPNMPIVSQPQLPVQEGWSTVLHFRTTRLFLRVGQSVEGASSKREPYLEDNSGNIVGLLECTAEEAQPRGRTIELICIGRMESPWTLWTRMFFGESMALHQGCPENCWNAAENCILGEEWIYRVYNVLWVEWLDGVAYRRALGRVFEKFWDESDTEEIDTRLG